MPATRGASKLSLVTLLVLGVAAGAMACTGIVDPPASPLDGLQYAVGSDSAGNTPPPAPMAPTPGYFQGTVLGPSIPGGGPDTLATSPRVAGVRLVAYALPAGGTVNADDLGDPVASVTTGADGKFTFPTLPGGTYVVTVTPPDGSIYGGVWVTATAHSTSHEFPWWVVLWKK